MAKPGYQIVADQIRAYISEQRLAEGDRLPTIRELAERLSVPTGTVARAIDLLRADGVVVSRHGNGLYVRTFPRIVRSSPGRLSKRQWGAGLAIQDHDTGQRLRVVHVDVTEVPAPGHVAAALSIPAGAAVLTRARKFAVENRVVQLATSYLPLEVVAAAPSVAYTGPGPGGIYARMAEVGLEPVEFVERLLVRLPTRAERDEMDLPTGVQVLEITRNASTAAGKCVEVNVMILDASVYRLEYWFASE
jgi:GntR family transcriptional regulator